MIPSDMHYSAMEVLLCAILSQDDWFTTFCVHSCCQNYSFSTQVLFLLFLLTVQPRPKTQLFSLKLQKHERSGKQFEIMKS